jgi:type II secretory pathway pseudopilin PulG
MAVLLAGLAIMGIAWTLVVPVWKQYVQREKEAELIFRAGQYARAVALYQRKYANAFPPSVEVLLREKFLRKKYKDPITKGDFRYLSPLELQALPALNTTTRPGRPGSSPPAPVPGGGRIGGPGMPGPNGPTAGPSAGIAAVVSRSSAASIKVFKNRQQYNQWVVTVQDVMPRSAAGTPQPGQTGPPGQSPTPFGPPGGSPGGSRPGFPSRPVP